MSIQYQKVTNEGRQTIIAFIDGQMKVTDSESNPMFDSLFERLESGDHENIADMFDHEHAINRVFEHLSERVSVANGAVYFDGDPVDNVLSKHILRLIEAGEDTSFLINFWEKIATNPSENSREHLMDWLRREDFSITADGDIVGYKGLREDGTSIHAGPGIVDGVEQTGHLPNNEGSVIELPRSNVDDDTFADCSYGLHVGTYDYASRFSRGRTVEVLVNPRDVVMVPSRDSDKMRVCRYKVGKVSIGLRDTAVVHDYADVEDVDDDWSEDYDDDHDDWGFR